LTLGTEKYPDAVLKSANDDPILEHVQGINSQFIGWEHFQSKVNLIGRTRYAQMSALHFAVRHRGRQKPFVSINFDDLRALGIVKRARKQRRSSCQFGLGKREQRFAIDAKNLQRRVEGTCSNGKFILISAKIKV
jgi:hypothetical protein